MKNKITKKWWFWAIVAFIILIIIVPSESNENENEKSIEKEEYTLTGGELGQFGKEVVLNEDTDMPTKKYIYKIPSGTYLITTDEKKAVAFSIVKDEIAKTGIEPYVEELQYVGSQNIITSGEEKEITLNSDESISLLENDSIIVTKK